jgi:hypothetical protein
LLVILQNKKSKIYKINIELNINFILLVCAYVGKTMNINIIMYSSYTIYNMEIFLRNAIQKSASVFLNEPTKPKS